MCRYVKNTHVRIRIYVFSSIVIIKFKLTQFKHEKISLQEVFQTLVKFFNFLIT